MAFFCFFFKKKTKPDVFLEKQKKTQKNKALFSWKMKSKMAPFKMGHKKELLLGAFQKHPKKFRLFLTFFEKVQFFGF